MDPNTTFESHQRSIARDFHTQVKERILPWQKANNREMPIAEQYKIATAVRESFPAGLVSDFQVNFYSPDAVINQKIRGLELPRIFKYRIDARNR